MKLKIGAYYRMQGDVIDVVIYVISKTSTNYEVKFVVDNSEDCLNWTHKIMQLSERDVNRTELKFEKIEESEIILEML